MSLPEPDKDSSICSMTHRMRCLRLDQVPYKLDRIAVAYVHKGMPPCPDITIELLLDEALCRGLDKAQLARWKRIAAFLKTTLDLGCGTNQSPPRLCKIGRNHHRQTAAHSTKQSSYAFARLSSISAHAAVLFSRAMRMPET